MSPAPVRQRTTADRFPYGWGYALGLVLVAAGIAVAVWGLVTGVGGFASDVNDLRRVLDGSALEASLEADELTEAELVGWMNAINSLRLVLGTRLDVSEDDDPRRVADDDPDLVILLENVDGTLASIRKYAEYLIEIISRPYLWDKTVLRISASIGHARYPNHGSTPSKVLSLADKALYQAKDAGKRQCITYGTSAAPKPARKEQPLRA